MKTFNEIQSARKTWMLLVFCLTFLAALAFFGWAMYVQLVLGIPVGSKPMSDTMLIVSSVVIWLLLGGLFGVVIVMKLRIGIDPDGLTFRFPPFMKRVSHRWSEVEYAWVRKYDPISEYGGWGYRTLRRKKAFNITGHFGIQVVLKNGKNFLIGIKDTEGAQACLTANGFGKPDEKFS